MGSFFKNGQQHRPSGNTVVTLKSQLAGGNNADVADLVTLLINRLSQMDI
jgi:hypothetical protein